MATMTRWDPFQDLRSAQDEMAQMSPMLAHALGLQGQPQGSGTAWAPALDISERKDAYLVTVELPGVEAEDLDITLEDGLLTIQGDRQFTSESSEQQFHRVERRYGAFRRSITLPPRSRPTGSRPRSTTGCSRSWCPRPRRPLRSASRSAPAGQRSLRQAVVRTRRPALSQSGASPGSEARRGRRRAGDAPLLPPPALSAGFNSDYNPSARRSSVTPPTPTRRPPQRGSLMPRYPRELTWDDAMQRGYEALRSGEALYEEIDPEQGRSNIDIEKHLRRADLKLAQANAWFAMARQLGWRRDDYGSGAR